MRHILLLGYSDQAAVCIMGGNICWRFSILYTYDDSDPSPGIRLHRYSDQARGTIGCDIVGLDIVKIVPRQFGTRDQTHPTPRAEPNVDEVDLETPGALDEVLVEQGDRVKDRSAPVLATKCVVFACDRPSCMGKLLGIENSVQDKGKCCASTGDRKDEKRVVCESLSPAHASQLIPGGGISMFPKRNIRVR